MKLVNSIFINRSPEVVWAFLEDPEHMLLWNPKVKQVSPSCFAEPKQGYRYDITYQMGASAVASGLQAEFVCFEPCSKLVIRQTGGLPSPQDRIIEETYELVERGGGTFLTQTIRVENSGINIFLRLLIWFIRKFGKPAGKPYLETFRDILEKGVAKGAGR
ncbi:MAG: SRPBCC family protein [Gallionella sp.]|nr:SRPBCC family protein [Gallionella sp.]